MAKLVLIVPRHPHSHHSASDPSSNCLLRRESLKDIHYDYMDLQISEHPRLRDVICTAVNSQTAEFASI